MQIKGSRKGVEGEGGMSVTTCDYEILLLLSPVLLPPSPGG